MNLTLGEINLVIQETKRLNEIHAQEVERIRIEHEAEISRILAAHQVEMDEMNSLYDHRLSGLSDIYHIVEDKLNNNRLINLKLMNAKSVRKVSIMERIKESIVTAWAVFYAIVLELKSICPTN